MKIAKYLTSRLSCHSFSTLDYIVLTWFKRAKPQIYCFLVGESKTLGSKMMKIMTKNHKK